VPLKTNGAATVDKSKVGLLGHSMGGGGVLYGAGAQCADKIKTVIALDPGCFSWDEDVQFHANCVAYAKEPLYSGTGGDYEMEVLKNIKAAVLLHTSRAQYNAPLMPNTDYCAMWPALPSIYNQLTSDKKEIYVDNFLVDESKTTLAEAQPICAASHTWMVSPSGLLEHGGGVPINVILSFTRRHLLGSGEEPMEKPEGAVEWETAAC